MAHAVDCSAKWHPICVHCTWVYACGKAVRKSTDLLITKLCIEVDLQKYFLWPAYKSTPQLSGRKLSKIFSTYTRVYTVMFLSYSLSVLSRTFGNQFDKVSQDGCTDNPTNNAQYQGTQSIHARLNKLSYINYLMSNVHWHWQTTYIFRIVVSILSRTRKLQQITKQVLRVLWTRKALAFLFTLLYAYGKPSLCINIQHYAPPMTVLQQAQHHALCCSRTLRYTFSEGSVLSFKSITW